MTKTPVLLPRSVNYPSITRPLNCLALVALCSAWLLVFGFTLSGTAAERLARPNILWLTCEDISPNLGCYGDAYAMTPNLDRLAAQSIRYTRAVGITGVCAVNRSCLITGMYSSTIGTQDMRCLMRLPESIRCFPEYLRKAGYYCTNNSKKDYNFRESADTWDVSSGKAHWKHRQSGQPFFAVFNYTGSHESQIWARNYKKHAAKLTPDQLHDPARAPLPPFHPDTPQVRRDWANYHDNITALDLWVGQHLRELAEADLAEQTIVFFFSDHGAGMPGVKKWIWNGGLQVPLLVHFPRAWQPQAPGEPGEVSDQLVSFVDFAPSALSLCGVSIPRHMQGQAFLGKQSGPPREYAYVIRDRMAEHYETIRGVRSERFQYYRNFMPHLPWVRFSSYTLNMPTAQVWSRMHEAGQLSAVQDRIFRQKPTEELYDLERDPHMIHNLASTDEVRLKQVLSRMREALYQWQLETRDLGLLPECEIHQRADEAGITPFLLAQDRRLYPLEQAIGPIAWKAGERDPANLELFRNKLADSDPTVRWWATLGLVILSEQTATTRSALLRALQDQHPLVRMAAAEGLCKMDGHDKALPVLIEGLAHPTPYIRLRSMNVLEGLGERARPALPAIKDAGMKGNEPAGYLNRMVEYLSKRLAESEQNDPKR